MNLQAQNKYKNKLIKAGANSNLDIYDLISYIVITKKFNDLWSPANGTVAPSKIYNMSDKRFQILIKDFNKAKEKK